jgi:hypothetical protein
MRFIALTFLISIISFTSFSQENWNIILHPDLQNDEAIKVAIEDLNKTGSELNIHFNVSQPKGSLKGNSILVDIPNKSEVIQRLAGELNSNQLPGKDGYRIATKQLYGTRTMLVTGADVVGAVYGLYRVWDRLRVYKEIPVINETREPQLKTRVSPSWGRRGADGNTKEEIRNALRNGINWVSGPPVLDLIDWDVEPEKTNNAKTRKEARELIKYAHSLHINFYSFAAEFTYHPSLLKKFNATLSPDDPKMWDALQEKYRMLFKAIPELDGIEICNDDISGFWENYRPYDIMFDENDSDWSYEKRFKTFMEKVHEVVSGEYNKMFMHFTWSLVEHKQHHQPAVFKQIFTDDLPAENLLLMPKITQSDRWWFQAYNPTFNQTQHPTAMAFETMNYYEGGKTNIFPTCAGNYYQAGIQYVLSNENTNMQGTAFRSAPKNFSFNTHSITPYMLNRLSWNPNEDIHQIVSDFCSINFGPAVADKMADIYLMSAQAYKYGLHIEPVSYGQYNSFIHMRVGTFPSMGYPRIDGGKEHLKFLKEIYLRCKPWIKETEMYLDHGLETAVEMCNNFDQIKDGIEDQKLAADVENKLLMTQRLIRTNNFYVKTFFDYFGYLENESQANKTELKKSYQSLVDTKAEFKSTKDFGYRLFGVDQVLLNAKGALDNRSAEISKMKNMPSREEVENTIRIQQARYKEVLEQYADEAIKFYEFEGGIDGRDILHIQEEKMTLEHLRWDPPFITNQEFYAPLPKQEYTVIPKDIESKPMHQFIFEQPSEQNDFMAQVYLYDLPGGTSVNHFELYYIPRSPKELGLEIPWSK